jgi:hypothetical protein
MNPKPVYRYSNRCKYNITIYTHSLPFQVFTWGGMGYKLTSIQIDPRKNKINNCSWIAPPGRNEVAWTDGWTSCYYTHKD